MGQVVDLQAYKNNKKWIETYLENYQPEYIDTFNKQCNNISKKQLKDIERELQLGYMRLLSKRGK